MNDSHLKTFGSDQQKDNQNNNEDIVLTDGEVITTDLKIQLYENNNKFTGITTSPKKDKEINITDEDNLRTNSHKPVFSLMCKEEILKLHGQQDKTPKGGH